MGCILEALSVAYFGNLVIYIVQYVVGRLLEVEVIFFHAFDRPPSAPRKYLEVSLFAVLD